jgi:metal-responsive CopG/Arc/MetJ family transcriptional regulator
MTTKPAPRRTITIDLPQEQIDWLDRQANQIVSRSAFVRQLIASAMQKAGQ